MGVIKNKAKSFLTNYISFLVGLVFGSAVATLTSYSLLGPPDIGGDSIANIDKFVECLNDE